MSALVVTAPLVVARVKDGGVRYLYQDAPVPTSELADGEVARLRALGFIGDPEKPATQAAKEPAKAAKKTAAPPQPAQMQAGNDPGDFTPEQVSAFLTTADDAERERVLAAERDGKNRAGVLKAYDTP